MSENLISTIRARFDHAAQKKILREKYQAKMTFAHAGGMWHASPALLSLLQICPDDEAVILDAYENPIKVNVPELRMLAYQRWQEQMNSWLTEWEQAQNQR